jgi:cell division protein FtsL
VKPLPPPARERMEGSWRYLLCLPVLAAAVIALAWPRLYDLRLRYEFRSLRAEQDRRVRENRRLRLKNAELRSLARIETIARRDLGLIDPAQRQILWVEAPSLARVREEMP